ncbi:MAG: MarR family transcriptional regulator [Candidatus Faecousia sp.]|nr:MarR family transcriptional regulator [Oscillospiraceae bacterium]MDY2557933.1 MarR family transcriptional regulator [Candidatus Faecousia sp.]
MDERFETFTVLINQISRSIRRIKAEQMESINLKGPHVSCLYYLSKNGPLTAAELCDRCEEDKAAVSRSLDYLEQNGYLQIPEGKRYRRPLVLTQKGSAAGAEVSRRIDSIVALASCDVLEEDRLAMYRALSIISKNLEKIYQNKEKQL